MAVDFSEFYEAKSSMDLWLSFLMTSGLFILLNMVTGKSTSGKLPLSKSFAKGSAFVVTGLIAMVIAFVIMEAMDYGWTEQYFNYRGNDLATRIGISVAITAGITIFLSILLGYLMLKVTGISTGWNMDIGKLVIFWVVWSIVYITYSELTSESRPPRVVKGKKAGGGVPGPGGGLYV